MSTPRYEILYRPRLYLVQYKTISFSTNSVSVHLHPRYHITRALEVTLSVRNVHVDQPFWLVLIRPSLSREPQLHSRFLSRLPG